MKVSRNEMNTALKRAYEGAGYDIGDYEDAAELITWSEMCGFNGFSKMTLPPPGPKGGATPRLVYEGNNNAVIDAGGADMCQYGSLAGDLVYAKASLAGMATVQLENCRNPLLILRNLSQVALRGAYVCAYWHDENRFHGASYEAGIEFPNYWSIDSGVRQETIGPSTITLLCSLQAGLLANAVDRQSESANAKRQDKSTVQLSASYDAALEYGIPVDKFQWQALNDAAWPILVSATSQSRLGAGPG